MYHIYILNRSLRRYFASSPDFEKAKKTAAKYATVHGTLTEVYDVGCYPHSVTLSICPSGTEAPIQWEFTEYDTPIPALKAFDELPIGIDVAVYDHNGNLLCTDYGSTYEEPYDWLAVNHVETNLEENFARIYLTEREINHDI